MKKMVVPLFCVLFILGTTPVMATFLNFEDLSDLTPVNDFYAAYGIHFQNTISLTAGFSLNEFDYPPSSGSVAIGDNFAPIQITFDNPMENLFGNFTYGSQLTFTAYDQFGSLIGSFINPGISNLGNTQLISLNFIGVSSLVIAGETVNSYIMDDFNFNPSSAPVPEPTTLVLLGGGLLGLVRVVRKRIMHC